MVKKLKIKTENDVKFKEGFDEFLENCKGRNLRPATLIHYQEDFTAITKFVDRNIPIKILIKVQ